MDLTGVIITSVFWLFIAFCVFISVWKQKKLETIRHETVRFLIEKNPAIDSATLAQILNPLLPSIKTGAAYRMMSVIGTIVVAVGVGLWLMCLWFVFVAGDNTVKALGGPATLVLVIGAGIIFAARFMPRPLAKDAENEFFKSSKNGLDL